MLERTEEEVEVIKPLGRTATGRILLVEYADGTRAALYGQRRIRPRRRRVVRWGGRP